MLLREISRKLATMFLAKFFAEKFRTKIKTEKALRQLKIQAIGKSGILPKNSELLHLYQKLLAAKKIPRQTTLEQLLKKSSIRTLSGIAPVAVLTKPAGCPGKCIFCPSEPGIPKSYLAKEPAVLRALRAKFDPYHQTRNRLQTLRACGHSTAKVELIILGGTFSAQPKNYQNYFLKRCLAALNLPRKTRKNDLHSYQKINETASNRLVGLTIETRPDFINPAEVQHLLKLGVTRVELGMQSNSDAILRRVKRGHDNATTIRAIKLLKDAGLKVGLHIMLNLPGATPASDYQTLQAIFTNPVYKPDQLKIYPTVLTRGSALIKLFRQKTWQPYSDQTLTKLLSRIKANTPEWLRLSRIIRDIPATEILAGSKITNLRQVLQKQGVHCRCIRCREIRSTEFKKTHLIRRDYEASAGQEIFLSYETPTNRLLSLLRLRLPPHSPTALIRELHSYGPALPISTRGKSAQHHGYGRRLISAAEKIATAAHYTKIKVTAGIGVRPYYRKFGYRVERKGTLMLKPLRAPQKR